MIGKKLTQLVHRDSMFGRVVLNTLWNQQLDDTEKDLTKQSHQKQENDDHLPWGQKEGHDPIYEIT